MSANVIAAMASGDPTFTSINMDGYDAIKRSANNLYLRILGSGGVGHGAHIELFGGTHASTPGDVNVIMGNLEAGQTPNSVYRVIYQANEVSTNVYIMDKLGNITTVGTIVRPIVAKTTNYTATASDENITMDATEGARTVTLPALVKGREYTIKRLNAGANAVTIDANAAETIDGALTVALNAQYESVTIIGGAAEWHIK